MVRFLKPNLAYSSSADTLWGSGCMLEGESHAATGSNPTGLLTSETAFPPHFATPSLGQELSRLNNPDPARAARQAGA